MLNPYYLEMLAKDRTREVEAGLRRGWLRRALKRPKTTPSDPMQRSEEIRAQVAPKLVEQKAGVAR